MSKRLYVVGSRSGPVPEEFPPTSYQVSVGLDDSRTPGLFPPRLGSFLGPGVVVLPSSTSQGWGNDGKPCLRSVTGTDVDQRSVYKKTGRVVKHF